MVMRWEAGRAEVDALLARGHLQRVPANRELAQSHLDQAQAHIELARVGIDTDPVGAFQLTYDAARKALAALLVVQGLRPTSAGGHLAVHDAVMAQFGSTLDPVFAPFGWMRRVRNASEYPSFDQPSASAEEAAQARAFAEAIVAAAHRLLDVLPVY